MYDFLNCCLIKKLSGYFVDFERIKNLFAHAIYDNLQDFLHNRLLKSLLTWTHAFLLAFLIFQNLFSSVCICMNVKTSKVLIVLFIKNIVTYSVMDTKCFINIIPYNDITANHRYANDIQLRTFKTQRLDLWFITDCMVLWPNG